MVKKLLVEGLVPDNDEYHEHHIGIPAIDVPWEKSLP